MRTSPTVCAQMFTKLTLAAASLACASAAHMDERSKDWRAVGAADAKARKT